MKKLVAIRLLVAVTIVGSGLLLAPYIALPNEHFTWQRFAGLYAYEPTIQPTTTAIPSTTITATTTTATGTTTETATATSTSTTGTATATNTSLATSTSTPTSIEAASPSPTQSGTVSTVTPTGTPGSRVTSTPSDPNATPSPTAESSVLSINYTTGRPGSFFTAISTRLGANVLVSILVNGRTSATLSTDATGQLLFLLDSTDALPGTYRIEVVSGTGTTATSAPIFLQLSLDAPLRAKEGDGPIVRLADNQPSRTILLPIVVHE